MNFIEIIALLKVILAIPIGLWTYSFLNRYYIFRFKRETRIIIAVSAYLVGVVFSSVVLLILYFFMKRNAKHSPKSLLIAISAFLLFDIVSYQCFKIEQERSIRSDLTTYEVIENMYPRIGEFMNKVVRNDEGDVTGEGKKTYDPDMFSPSEIKYLEKLDSLEGKSVYLGDLKKMMDFTYDSGSVPYNIAIPKILKEKYRLLNSLPYTDETLEKMNRIDPEEVFTVENMLRKQEMDMLMEQEMQEIGMLVEQEKKTVPEIYEYDYEIISYKYSTPRYVEIDLFYRITEGDKGSAETRFYHSAMTLKQRIEYDLDSGLALHSIPDRSIFEYGDDDGYSYIDSLEDPNASTKFNLLYNRTPMEYR